MYKIMSEPSLPTAVEIVEIRIPVIEILEGQRIPNNLYNLNVWVFPICICMFCIIMVFLYNINYIKIY